MLFVRGDKRSEKALIAVVVSGKTRILASLARGCLAVVLPPKHPWVVFPEAFKGHVYQATAGAYQVQGGT